MPIETRSLLRRVAAGESDAMSHFMDEYGGLVFSIARRLTARGEDVEDAVQEVFLDIWRHASRFDPTQGSETTFVATVSRRRCIDRLRKRGRRVQTTSLEADLHELADGAQTEVERLESEDEAAGLARFVAQLRPVQRTALELSICHGWSHSQIAENLGLPLGTVKTHIRRGLSDVRRTVEKSRCGVESSGPERVLRPRPVPRRVNNGTTPAPSSAPVGAWKETLCIS